MMILLIFDGINWISIWKSLSFPPTWILVPSGDCVCCQFPRCHGKSCREWQTLQSYFQCFVRSMLLVQGIAPFTKNRTKLCSRFPTLTGLSTPRLWQSSGLYKGLNFVEPCFHPETSEMNDQEAEHRAVKSAAHGPPCPLAVLAPGDQVSISWSMPRMFSFRAGVLKLDYLLPWTFKGWLWENIRERGREAERERWERERECACVSLWVSSCVWHFCTFPRHAFCCRTQKHFYLFPYLLFSAQGVL